MKKLASLLLSFLLFCSLLTGCKSESFDEGTSSPVTLTVVSEYATDATHGGTAGSFAYTALKNIIAKYEEDHEGVTVELTILPSDTSEREITLQNLRTEIMSGKGPDLFLLPAGSVANSISVYDFHTMEPLFLDVQQAMESRVFADLSSYYDNDEELKTEELKQDIMDAGVYDGCRYVLPIGWNMPVVAVNLDRVESLGMDEDVFYGGVSDIIQAAIDFNDEGSLSLMNYPPDSIICALPNLFDYQKDSLLLTEEDLRNVFSVYAAALEKWASQLPDNFSYLDLPILTGDLFEYTDFFSSEFFLNGDTAFALSDLYHAADILAIGQAEGIDLTLLPLRSLDGSAAAEITYFGAVNAGCEHTEEAYELLRMFLTPEVQFHQTLSTGTTRLWEDDCAWPVRVTGSVQGKLSASVAHADSIEEPVRDISAIHSIQLADDDLLLLKESIDHVTFRTSLTYDFSQTMSELTPENAAEKTADFITSAKYHIAEA